MLPAPRIGACPDTNDCAHRHAGWSSTGHAHHHNQVMFLVMLSCADAHLNRYTDPWRAHHYVCPRSSLGHRLRPMSSQLRVRVRILMRICARCKINE